MAIGVLGLAGLVVAAWGVSHLRAATREAAAERAYPPSGQFVEVEGTAVHYAEAGDADAPAVVLIHGLSGNLRDMTFSLMQRLAEDHRVIAFDRPGMGYTAQINASGDSIAAQAQVLRAAAEALGAERPIVLGQSYGGAVALAWATLEPEALSGLVLLGAPSHPWEGGMSTLYRVTSHPVLGPAVIPFLAAWVPETVVQRAVEGVFTPQAMPEGYDAHIGAPLSIRRSALRANAQHRAGLLAQIEALAPRYAEAIRVPVEVLHGTEDTTVSLEIHSRPLAERVPQAHLTALEGIGHMPHHAREGAVVEAVKRVRERADPEP